MTRSRGLSPLVTCMLLVALASCGDDDSSDPDASPSSSATETAGASTQSSDAGSPAEDPESASATPDAADAEATLRAYLAAYESGDVAKACDLSLPAYGQSLVKSGVQQDGVEPGATCEEVMKWGHDLMAAFGATLDPEGLTVTVKGDKATAPATYDGEEFTYFLTFVDGNWLVSGDSDEGYLG